MEMLRPAEIRPAEYILHVVSTSYADTTISNHNELVELISVMGQHIHKPVLFYSNFFVCQAK